MADNDLLKIVAIFVGAYLLFGQGIDGQTTVNGNTGTTSGNQVIPPDVQCTYAPTVQLGANDKYNSGQTNWGNWKYILNGGTATTDEDGSFEVAKGDSLKVLVADSNSSTYYRALWEMTISKCGTQPIAYNDIVKLDTGATVQCFNDINQPINGTTFRDSYANYTVGTGGGITSRCELRTTAKTGAPYGAIVILELNSTTYKENDLGLQWDGAAATAMATPGAYKLGAATGTTRTFEVPPFGAQASLVIPFYISAQAETSENPGVGYVSPANYGDAIIGYIIPKNCYEEEDVTPTQFKCGYEDIDGTFVAPGGTTKANAAIASFAIPVQ